MKVPPVLGLTTWEALSLVHRVMTVGNDQSCTRKMKSEDENEIIRKFNDVFEALGRLGKHHIVLDQSVPVAIHPARRVPFALKDKLKNLLDSLYGREL